MTEAPAENDAGIWTGIEIDWLGGNCPVQAEGRIDGEPFYFRARGEHWRLDIGRVAFDSHPPLWRHEEAWGDGPFAAGWMPEDVAREMIAKGAELYRRARLEGTT